MTSDFFISYLVYDCRFFFKYIVVSGGSIRNVIRASRYLGPMRKTKKQIQNENVKKIKHQRVNVRKLYKSNPRGAIVTYFS